MKRRTASARRRRCCAGLGRVGSSGSGNANRPVWREHRRGGVSGARARREARPARLSARERRGRASVRVGGRHRIGGCTQGVHDADPGRDIAHLGHAGSVHAGRCVPRPHAVRGARDDGTAGPGAHAPASRARDGAPGRDAGNVGRGPGHGDAKQGKDCCLQDTPKTEAGQPQRAARRAAVACNRRHGVVWRTVG